MIDSWKKIFITKKQVSYQKKLANGMLVCLMPNQEYQNAHATFTVRYGSIHRQFIDQKTSKWYEAPDGVAHFLEHKLFDQPDGSDVFQQFSELGVSANAFTTYTHTSYLFQDAHDHFLNALTLLLDYVQTPYFTDESVEKEKGIIEQEIQMYEDQFSWVGYRLALENAYKIHPVGIDIAGTTASIKKITKEDLYLCYETFYQPSNMHLVVSGCFDLERTIELIEGQAKEILGEPIIIQEYQDTFPPQEKYVVKKIDATINYVIGLFKNEHSNQLTQHDQAKKECIDNILLDMIFSELSPHYDSLRKEKYMTSFVTYANYDAQYSYFLLQAKTKKPQDFIDKLLEIFKTTTMINKEQFDIIHKAHLGDYLMYQNNPKVLIQEMSQLLPDQLTILDMQEIFEQITLLDIEQRYEEIVQKLDDYLSFVILENRV